MEKNRFDYQKNFRALIFLCSFLTIVTLVILLGVLYFNSQRGTSTGINVTEKITEKQVYLESSGYIDSLDIIKPSIMTLLNDKGEQATAVLLTNDGYLLINTKLSKENLLSQKVFDYLGNQYDLEWLGEYETLTFARALPKGQLAVEANAREVIFTFKPALFADLEKQKMGQKLIYVQSDKDSSLKLLGETMISKNHYQSNFPQAINSDQKMYELAYTDKNYLIDDKFVFNLGGELTGIVSDQKEISITDIKGMLARYDLKNGLRAKISYGFVCTVLDPDWVFRYSLSADYGCLIGSKIDQSGKVLPGGIIKGSLAEKIGLKEGDLIIEFDNKSLLENHLYDDLQTKSTSSTLFFRVIRDGKGIELKGGL